MNEGLPGIMIGMVSILIVGVLFFVLGIYAGKKKEQKYFY